MKPSTPAQDIYNKEYAAQYPFFYIDQWKNKHTLNIKNIRKALATISQQQVKWLDTACGQAWHFSQINEDIIKVGLDLSPAQLHYAAINNLSSHFVHGDICNIPFSDDTFDLVTNFWAAYCYLDDMDLIGKFIRQAIRATRTGGAIYFELLLPEDLSSFNKSRYADATGFRTSPREADFSRWRYEDSGGIHDMTSPPLDFFKDALISHFANIEVIHDSQFMVHMLATGKLPSDSPPHMYR
jgi:SAM-dependent methyltransferase